MSQSVNKTSVARTTRRSERAAQRQCLSPLGVRGTVLRRDRRAKALGWGWNGLRRVTEDASLSVMSGGDLVDVRLCELLLPAIRHPLGVINALP